MSRRNKNKPYNIFGGTTNTIISTIERFTYDIPLDENEEIIFSDLNEELSNLGSESSRISPNTLLHKILNRLIYQQLYIELYDDLDWISDLSDFTDYVIDTFNEVNVGIPKEFFSKNETIVYQARDDYHQYFLDSLKFYENSAFAYLFYRKSFLYSFNYKISQYQEQKQKRVYYPKWLIDILLYRERGLCHYCQTPVANPSQPNQTFDIDHIIPLDKFGTNDPTNFVISCWECNNRKRTNFINIPETFHWPQFD